MKTFSTGLEKPPTGISGLDEVLYGGIPKCLVVDPLSAMTSIGGLVHASRVAERLITFAKGEEITAVYTCLPQQ